MRYALRLRPRSRPAATNLFPRLLSHAALKPTHRDSVMGAPRLSQGDISCGAERAQDEPGHAMVAHPPRREMGNEPTDLQMPTCTCRPPNRLKAKSHPILKASVTRAATENMFPFARPALKSTQGPPSPPPPRPNAGGARRGQRPTAARSSNAPKSHDVEQLCYPGGGDAEDTSPGPHHVSPTLSARGSQIITGTVQRRRGGIAAASVLSRCLSNVNLQCAVSKQIGMQARA